MHRLRAERGGLSILYITHDIATTEYLAEDTAVMFGGQIVEVGPPTSEVVGAPAHPYTQLLRAAVPSPPRKRLSGSDKAFVTQADDVRAACYAPVEKLIERGPGGHLCSLLINK